MKCVIIPEIIGATEIEAKGLKKNSKVTSGKHSAVRYKRAILGT